MRTIGEVIAGDRKGDYADEVKKPEEPEVKAEPDPKPEAEAPKEAKPETGEEAPEKVEKPEQEPKAEKPKDEPPSSEAMVPRKALEDERRKRQEYEQRIREWERRQKPAKQPDPISDPEGYARHVQKDTRLAMLNERLNMSEMTARAALGEETVNEAVEAFEQAMREQPALHQAMLQHKHPYQFIVDWHKREQVLGTVGTDLSAYEQRLREKWLEELKADPSPVADLIPPPQPERPKAPSPSLSGTPSAGKRDTAWTGPRPLTDIIGKT